MKKLIATLAITGLGAGLAAGAQAQTISGGVAPTSYSLMYTLLTPTSASTPQMTDSNGSAYQYTYMVTLEHPTSNVDITTLAFSGIKGYVNDSALPGGTFAPSATGSGFGAISGGTITDTTDANGFGTVNYLAAAGTGLTAASPTTDLSFFDTLPPTGFINPSADAGPVSSSGTPVSGGLNSGTIMGPGTAVPEAGSFALLGLGLLPLALVARRRMSRSN